MMHSNQPRRRQQTRRIAGFLQVFRTPRLGKQPSRVLRQRDPPKQTEITGRRQVRLRAQHPVWAGRAPEDLDQ